VGEKALRPLWLAPENPPEPHSDVAAWLWSWQDIRAGMIEACDLMPVGEDGADRRVLTMRNPSFNGFGATKTLSSAVQLVKPGEEAPSHRHTMAALRFIIEGAGGYTIVEGEPLSMEPGDFLLTPAWTWHGHAHEGTEYMMWLDVLDVPLVRGLDLGFYEELAEPHELQKPEKPMDDSVHRFGTGSLLPTWMGRPNTPYSPLFSYKWGPTREALYRLTDMEPSPTEGYALTFTNPFTGGPVMPTIGAGMHLLKAGQHTTAKRSTVNSIFHVAQGSGYSVIAGKRFDWRFGDTFCVPVWNWVEHVAANEDAILFTANDLPVVQALALHREQVHPNGHQAISATFDGLLPASPAGR
ncbi:MAG: cupin domain-containing protein, partial [Chloroflexi bacterium]|nr:cupin domain-containing protein [Chloroflexota bacterium]